MHDMNAYASHFPKFPSCPKNDKFWPNEVLHSYLFHAMSEFNTEGVTGFFRIVKAAVLKTMLMIIFWKLTIVKTSSKKTGALIYSMKLLSPEASVYLYAAELSFLFVLNLWLVVEMWLSLWNMICDLWSKLLLQTG